MERDKKVPGIGGKIKNGHHLSVWGEKGRKCLKEKEETFAEI